MVCADPFEQKIFNALLAHTDLQPQVFTRLDESKQSHGRIFIWMLFVRTKFGSWRCHERVHIHYVKVTPVIHQELNRFLKIYSSLPWGTDYKRRSRQNPT